MLSINNIPRLQASIIRHSQKHSTSVTLSSMYLNEYILCNIECLSSLTIQQKCSSYDSLHSPLTRSYTDKYAACTNWESYFTYHTHNAYYYHYSYYYYYYYGYGECFVNLCSILAVWCDEHIEKETYTYRYICTTTSRIYIAKGAMT